ncbi:lipid A deacylase LpxR family protein [Polaribacter sp.]|nr:lipid A deacylase LpxR family protein [Polaribacter sp.]
MRYLGVFFLSFFSFLLHAQEKYSKQFGLVTDNDLYISFSKDRYYTSGIFLKYSYLKKNNNQNLSKKIFKWSLNHKIYTPINPTVKSKGAHDRPFAGYLYGEFEVNNVYKKNAIFKFSGQFGLIGEYSYAEELQSIIHSVYNFSEIVGWQYQIANAVGINVKADYIKNLHTSSKNKFDFNWVNTAKLGTVFTDISTGFYSRIGFKELQKMSNSIGFNTNLNDETTSFFNEAESFIYFSPKLRYALYDATLQGSFLNTSSPITKELIPLVFDFELGFRYIKKRFSFGYAIHFYSNKSEGLRTTESNRYGKISLDYLFK